ncbi:MAG TPA: mechanosensitive ion channel family protein [Solirubrobacteraceae bacterium]|nr:mechanosensitive ion channel family protein [Solirubrobacteraceae bacterium]
MTGSIAPGARRVAASDGLDAVLSFLVDKPLAILGILVGAFIVGKLARRLVKLLVRRVGRRRARRGPGLLRRHTPAALVDTGELLSPPADQRIEALAVALAGATSFVVWLVGTLAVLHVLGVRLGPLLTGAGLIGVALGFGAQSLIRDFIAGLFILVEDQFGVGDWVDLDEVTGAVEVVTLRATRIRSVDGTVWHVSNGQIQRAGNMSQHWSRALLDVQIALDSDIDRAREAMKRVADELWHEDRAIIEEPEVWGVQSLGPSGITIRLVATTKPLEQWRITRLLRGRLSTTQGRREHLQSKRGEDRRGRPFAFPRRSNVPSTGPDRRASGLGWHTRGAAVPDAMLRRLGGSPAYWSRIPPVRTPALRDHCERLGTDCGRALDCMSRPGDRSPWSTVERSPRRGGQ